MVLECSVHHGGEDRVEELGLAEVEIWSRLFTSEQLRKHGEGEKPGSGISFKGLSTVITSSSWFSPP